MLWAGELGAVHGRFVHRFNREEPRQSALAYMRRLVAPLERKNGWTLAEEVGHAGPDRIHRLLKAQFPTGVNTYRAYRSAW